LVQCCQVNGNCYLIYCILINHDYIDNLYNTQIMVTGYQSIPHSGWENYSEKILKYMKHPALAGLILLIYKKRNNLNKILAHRFIYGGMLWINNLTNIFLRQTKYSTWIYFFPPRMRDGLISEKSRLPSGRQGKPGSK